MGDYFANWLSIGSRADADKLPKLFWVNWFRKDESGKFMWPGFGENSRVLKWVLERVEGTVEASDTAIGRVPTAGSLDTTGLDISADTLARLLAVDKEMWRQEVPQIEEHYANLGERVPAALHDQLAALEKRLAG
jgi:phosphoenolpyruvate carboxykinase (GTP)